MNNPPCPGCAAWKRHTALRPGFAHSARGLVVRPFRNRAARRGGRLCAVCDAAVRRYTSGRNAPSLAIALLVACGPSAPPCAPEGDLRQLEREHEDALVAACAGVPTDEPCPEAHRINDEYAQKRERWTTCR